MILSSCKYNVYTNNVYKLNYPIIQVCGDDPYGDITMIIKKKLRMKNILYTDCQKNIEYEKSTYILLYIVHTSEQCIKTALFQNGEPAEYQMTLSLTAKVKTQNNIFFVFDTKTSRAFFDNPSTILSSSIKKNNIRQIIYEDAAEKLINQLLLYNKNNN